HVSVRVEQVDTPFTAACSPGQVLSIPINHGEGNYFAPDDVLDALERDRRVIFRYVDAATGAPSEASNPNGAARSIAGICSERRNVVGMMPHPERACEPMLGSGDGLVLFESVVNALSAHGALRTEQPWQSTRGFWSPTVSRPRSPTGSSAGWGASRRSPSSASFR